MKAIYPSWIYPSWYRIESLVVELGIQVVGDEGVMMKNVVNDEKEVIQVVVNDVKEMIKVVGLVIIKDCMEGVVMYE